jgi:hypothetical protein
MIRQGDRTRAGRFDVEETPASDAVEMVVGIVGVAVVHTSARADGGTPLGLASDLARSERDANP